VKPSRSRNQHELDDEDYGPSRTQQRREALAVLTLAGQLIELQPSRLAKLSLPDDVRREIDITRRNEDADCAAVRAELGENREKQRQENAAMHRLEAVRDRLIADDESALSELITEYPQLDRQRLRSLVRQARIEKDTPNKPPKAYREIFQFLKDLAQSDDSAEA
jgi:ribosome-associated protein